MADAHHGGREPPPVHIEHAQAFYELLTTLALEGLLTLTRRTSATDIKDGAKTIEEAVRQHQRILAMLIDYEADLAKRSSPNPAGADATTEPATDSLDLDAARAEVGRELARLFDARGGDAAG